MSLNVLRYVPREKRFAPRVNKGIYLVAVSGEESEAWLDGRAASNDEVLLWDSTNNRVKSTGVSNSEVQVLNGAVIGTSVANKALIVDSNKNVGSINTIGTVYLNVRNITTEAGGSTTLNGTLVAQSTVTLNGNIVAAGKFVTSYVKLTSTNRLQLDYGTTPRDMIRRAASTDNIIYFGNTQDFLRLESANVDLYHKRGSTEYKVWTEASDGSGSGLNADLLDDQHGSYYRNVANMNAGILAVVRGGLGYATWATNNVPVYDTGLGRFTNSYYVTQFLRADADDDFSGTLNYTPSTGIILRLASKQAIRKTSANGGLMIGCDDGLILGSGEAAETTRANVNVISEIVHIASDDIISFYSNLQNGWASRNTMEFRTDGQLYIGGNQVFHTGNDGNGFVEQTSANRPGVTRLYRRDSDTPYNVQVSWKSVGFLGTSRWWLEGYSNDTYHAPCYVDAAGNSDLLDGQHGSYYQNASNLNAGTVNIARIPSLDTSKITTGVFSTDRLPTIPVSKGGTGQTTLTAESFLLGNGTSGIVQTLVKFKYLDINVDWDAQSPLYEYTWDTGIIAYYNSSIYNARAAVIGAGAGCLGSGNNAANRFNVMFVHVGSPTLVTDDEHHQERIYVELYSSGGHLMIRLRFVVDSQSLIRTTDAYHYSCPFRAWLMYME